MNQLKLLILRLLSIPILNLLLRIVIYPFKHIVPAEQLVRIPIVGQIEIQYAGLNKFVMVADGRDSLATRMYWEGTTSFEASETMVYSALLNNAETILDIGANTGLFSLIAGVHNHPTKVYSFEPMPTIAAALRRNILTNQFKQIEVFEMALTDTDGDITLHVPIQGTLPMGSSTAADFRHNTKPIKVTAMTLDSFIEQQQIKKVDLMKIDTESTESAVLRGGVDLINRDRPLIMCEILNDKFAQPIAAFLDQKEYLIYRIEEEGIYYLDEVMTKPDATNFLFVPSEKQSFIPSHLMVLNRNEKKT